MANARIARNNTGHDRTGIKAWKWKQVRECFIDPCVSARLERITRLLPSLFFSSPLYLLFSRAAISHAVIYVRH